MQCFLTLGKRCVMFKRLLHVTQMSALTFPEPQSHRSAEKASVSGRPRQEAASKCHMFIQRKWKWSHFSRIYWACHEERQENRENFRKNGWTGHGWIWSQDIMSEMRSFAVIDSLMSLEEMKTVINKPFLTFNFFLIHH